MPSFGAGRISYSGIRFECKSELTDLLFLVKFSYVVISWHSKICFTISKEQTASLEFLVYRLEVFGITVLPLKAEMCDKALNYFHDYLAA